MTRCALDAFLSRVWTLAAAAVWIGVLVQNSQSD